MIGKQKISDATNASGVAKLKMPADAGKGKDKAYTDAYPDYTDAKPVQFKIKG